MSIQSEIVVRLRRRLSEMREAAMNSLASGHAKDFSEYRYLIGGLQKINQVDEAIEEIIDDMRKG